MTEIETKEIIQTVEEHPQPIDDEPKENLTNEMNQEIIQIDTIETINQIDTIETLPNKETMNEIEIEMNINQNEETIEIQQIENYSKSHKNKEDFLQFLIDSIKEHIYRAKEIMTHSLSTEKYTKTTLIIISILFIIVATINSSMESAIGSTDPQHIFEYLFFIKLTHIGISVTKVNKLPSFHNLLLYIIIGIVVTMSMSCMYLYQTYIRFPMQTLGQSMRFIPILLMRPIFPISMKRKDLVMGMLAYAFIIVFVIVSEGTFKAFVMLTAYITFDAFVTVLQSKYFVSDTYFNKLFYTSVVSCILFVLMSVSMQRDLKMQEYKLCIIQCVASGLTQITSEILSKNTRGKVWNNACQIVRQFTKLCHSFVIARSLTSLQFGSASLVFLCLFIHGVSTKVPTKYEKKESVVFNA